jgi:hypothetical protein
MTMDDRRFAELIRSAMPPVADTGPARDVWPLITQHEAHGVTWSWVDTALAAIVAIGCVAWPDLLLLLAYHF